MDSQTVLIISGVWTADGSSLHLSSSKIVMAILKCWVPFMQERDRHYHKLALSAGTFSSCSAILETILSYVVIALCFITTNCQQSPWCKILNTAEHEREGSDWPAGNTFEESAYMDKLKHVPACFSICVMDSVAEFLYQTFHNVKLAFVVA
jgi:hypothetical protein